MFSFVFVCFCLFLFVFFNSLPSCSEVACFHDDPRVSSLTWGAAGILGSSPPRILACLLLKIAASTRFYPGLLPKKENNKISINASGIWSRKREKY